MATLTAKHKPYPTYNSSGVEWLSEVPAHWEVRRLKHSVFKSDVRVKANGIAHIPYVGLENVESRTGKLLPLDEQQSPENMSNAFATGDVLFGKLRPYLAKALCPNFTGLCSTEFLVIKPFQYCPGFLCYLFLTNGFVSLIDSSTYGAKMPRANWEFVGNSILPLPPFSEQRAIVAFLDRETGKIDALISRKERLIELLQEKRTALISRAVTKGLDANAPIKESGVEWLGEIPAHWEVQRLRYLASIKTGDRDTVDRQDDGKYPFFVRSQTVERIDSWSFDGEAVLTAGDGVGVGKVFHYVNGKFDYHQRVYRFSDFRSVTGKYFFRYFKAMLRFEVLQGTAKSTVDSLRLPMLKDFPVLVPPLAEQGAVTAFLDRETAKLESLIAQVHQAIELLKELRSALISAAVTGRIDVREETECT